jgi:prevent-host-death family protein
MCYKVLRSCSMKTISQRELRNGNAAVMDGIERGETYTVTRRGVPVARIVPATGEDAGLRCVRPARARFVPGALRRVAPEVPTSVVHDELRGER